MTTINIGECVPKSAGNHKLMGVDGTMGEDGGVIVMDNGQLVCRTTH